ncbi:MAG: hypothetical protein GYA24_08105, partial [Candidatus Lokiarchaeota archaeon]|nr:hypothetical protein [Candidatus Lokiarchaeota archaeon]
MTTDSRTTFLQSRLFFAWLMPALLVSVGIFGLSNVASATVDADLDGVDDAVEAANARSVHATINSTNVLFDSRRGSDRLLFDINLGVEGFSVRFGHFETGDIPTQDDFTSFSMFRLIEYNNLDGNFVYNPGVDQSIAEY